MSGSTLILGVSCVPLIQNPFINAEIPLIEGRSTAPNPQLGSVIYAAKWVVSISLAVTMTCQTGIALLSRSLDRKGSLKISNRYLRLFPRELVIGIVLCLPIERSMAALPFLSIVVSLLMLCLMWEWIASLESDGAFLEP